MLYGTLTAHDVRALKHADSLCFDRLADGTSQIRAIRDAANSDTGFDQTHTVNLGEARLESYGVRGENYTAFEMITNAKYHPVARTLVKHMRAGTRVSLRWTADNSSPVTKDAGLVRDELHMQIQAANAKVADTYLVCVRVGLDNSARMIREA